MSKLSIEINDAGIVVADANAVLANEPGYALVEKDGIVTGAAAYGQARLKPRQVSNRYWAELSLDSGTAGVAGVPNAAELAFAQLTALWKRFGERGEDVVLVVPSHYSTEQLGLLLGLAQECGMPVRAMIDAAAAASTRPYMGHQLMYVDAGLHRASATGLEQGAEVSVRREQGLEAAGLAGLNDVLARRVAELFVLATRFDPFHEAESEQLLYDRLPEWLQQFHSAEQAELALPYGGDEFRVEVAREQLLSVAAGFYRALVQLIAQNREPGQSLVVQLSDRLAGLPGLAAALARLDEARVVLLPPGHAAQSVLLPSDVFDRSRDDVKLLKHLRWREQATEPGGEREEASRSRAQRSDEGLPTHVVYRGIAYRVDGQGLVIGRAPLDGRRVIVVDDQNSGVSRAHCELVFRDGELRLRDLSRFGTFVNERRISGEVALRPADVIRIGSPGAELSIVMLEDGHGAS